jgi:hypothetical protein
MTEWLFDISEGVKGDQNPIEHSRQVHSQRRARGYSIAHPSIAIHAPRSFNRGHHSFDSSVGRLALRIAVREVRRATLPGILSQVVPAECFVNLAAFFEVPVVGSRIAAVLVEPLE